MSTPKGLTRQARRYEPYASDPYRELNQVLTALLNRYGEGLRGAKVLDFGCGERPFELFFSRFGAQTVACDLQQNRLGTVDVLLDRESSKLPFEADCLFTDSACRTDRIGVAAVLSVHLGKVPPRNS